MRQAILVCVSITATYGFPSAETLRDRAIDTMARATRYFRAEVATEGGYLWRYKHDFTARQGEYPATPTQIWVQPPGTPSVGIAYLEAFEATGDTLYRAGAVEAARALAWGQLSNGGWDYVIDFDPENSKRWHYRRDVVNGDVEPGEREHRSTFDDNTSQSAMQLLMRVDKLLDFKDAEIHSAVQFGLAGFLKAQYQNGAWPQRYTRFPDPANHSPKKARYPDSWPRTWPDVDYYGFLTFNDGAMEDLIETMLEAHETYGRSAYLDAALACGEFMIRAQMPEPQPAWAQQYNHDMEPGWARPYEVASVTGGESYGVMRALMNLYVYTDQNRFLTPIEPALAWMKRSLLPDGRLARFYELKTNRPLYFVRDTYELTYSDADMPTHYSFKVSSRISRIERELDRIRKTGREALVEEKKKTWSGMIDEEDQARLTAIVESLDEKGRWLEEGRIRLPDDGRDTTQLISSRTFVRNMRRLTRYIALTR